MIDKIKYDRKPYGNNTRTRNKFMNMIKFQKKVHGKENIDIDVTENQYILTIYK